MADDQFGLHRVWPTQLNTANASSNTTIDIVAIHGLDTYSPRTWEAYAKEGDDSSRQVNWLQDEDMLPSKIPSARIYTYDWNSRTSKDASCEHLGSHVMSFLFELSCREDSKKRPLIFIASCYGGVLLAKALNFASMAHNEYRHILDATIGIVFLGTPFRGSNKLAMTGAQLRVLIAGAFGAEISTNVMRELDIENGMLQELVEIFARLVSSKDHHIPVTCFFETRITDISKAIQNLPSWFRSVVKAQTSVILVDQDSACLQGVNRLPLATNHAMLNKYRGPNDQNFKRVVWKLQAYIEIWEKKTHTQQMNRPGVGLQQNGTRATSYADADINVHWIVNRKVKPTFTGRKNDICHLEQTLSSVSHMAAQKQCEIFVITGKAGIGKSELCLKVANLVRSRFWGVFWIDVGNSLLTNEGFLHVAAKISNRTRTSLDDAFGVLSRCRKPWLLVLDNANDTNMSCSSFFSSWTTGTILIVAENPKCDKFNTIGHMELKVMAEDDAIELFYKSAEIPGSQRQEFNNVVETIVIDHLHCHALAVTLAGAHIKVNFSTPLGYLAVLREFKAHGEQLKDLNHPALTTDPKYPNIQASLMASLRSLELAKCVHYRDALCLLGILVVVDSSPFPVDVFEVAWKRGSSRTPTFAESTDELYIESFGLKEWHYNHLPDFLKTEGSQFDSRLKAAIDLLQSLSLIQQDRDATKDTACLSLHPTTHCWANLYLTPEDRQSHWIRAATVVALSCEDDAPKAYDQQLPIHFQALNNMQRAIEFRDVPPKELSALLFSCYKASNRYSKTMPCQDLISRVFSVLELDPKIALVPYMELYIEEARRLESGTSCEASVSLLDMLARACESKLSERPSARLRVQHELACVYLRSNQLSRSIELFQHVVKTRGTVLGESSPDYLQSQKMLGEAYRANGQNEEALSLSQSANIKAKPINESHPDYLPSQFQLAMTYLATRRPDKATEVLRHAEKLHAEKIAVNDRPHLTLKFHLARAYLMSGEVKNATELLEEIIDIHIKRGEGEHRDCQILRYELCHAYNRSGQPHKTVQLLQENLNTQKEIAPKNHPAMLTSQFILGLAYNMLGQNKEALHCFQRAVEGRKANGDDPGIFIAWEIELATAYIANVENEKGIEILQGIVKGRETVLPPSDRRLLYIQAQLARAYAHNGQAEESHKLLQHIQYIQEQALGQLHPVR